MTDFACQFIAAATAKNRFFGEVGDARIAFIARCETIDDANQKLSAMIDREGWRPIHPEHNWTKLRPPPRDDPQAEANLREIGEHSHIHGEPPSEAARFSED